MAWHTKSNRDTLCTGCWYTVTLSFDASRSHNVRTKLIDAEQASAQRHLLCSFLFQGSGREQVKLNIRVSASLPVASCT
jgi:hypothetical protein